MAGKVRSTPSTFLLTFLMIGLLGSVVFAQSQDPPSQPPKQPEIQSGVLTTISRDLIREGLKPLGLNWQEKEDSDGLTAFHLVEGEVVRFTLYQYRTSDGGPTTSLGVSAGYALTSPVDPRKVNDWNAGTRFTKAYFDNEGDPFLTQDLDLAGGTTLKAVTEFVRSFKANQIAFEKQFLGRESGAPFKQK